MSAGTPLGGMRVLDLSRALAGPLVGRIFESLGADVVKIEPPGGDITRYLGDVRHGLSGYFTQQNAGKRNVCIDLHAQGGADLFVRLAAHADVVIENYRPGVLDRLGIGWEVLHAANPRLVLVSISGYGQRGPESARAALRLANAGLVADSGDPDAPEEAKIERRRALTAALLSGFEDRAQLAEALERAGAVWGDVRSQTEAFASPSAEARQVTRLVDDRGGGQRRVVQVPYHFSDAECVAGRSASYRGEHNASVLDEWLGMPAAEIGALEQAGVLLAEKRDTPGE